MSVSLNKHLSHNESRIIYAEVLQQITSVPMDYLDQLNGKFDHLA